MRQEVGEMPIWQNHEQRIVTIEVRQDELTKQIENIEKAVREEGSEQKALLNKLIEHHLDTNKIKLSQFWKVVLNLTGASSILGVIVYAAFQFFAN